MAPQLSPEHSADTSKLQVIANQLKASFSARKTHSLESRLHLLQQLEALVQDNQTQICAAISEDLGRPTDDSILAELSVVIEEIQEARRHLKKWMSPEKKMMPLVLFPARGWISPVPYGVVLIIGPWNYPFQLLLAPLASALAAGNSAVVKPSELTPRCSALIAQLIGQYLPADVVQVIEGDAQVSKALLQEKWDFIFFTGSTQVGRLVAQAAARHLTPVVLELGGKSPCIIDDTANLRVAAKRILWGKMLNAGQTCVAPDYIFAPHAQVEPLLAEIKLVLKEFFPNGFSRRETFCGIVNQGHYDRLKNMLDAHRSELRLGGTTDAGAKLIEPSFFVLPSKELTKAPLMGEEIFGPLMPIIGYHHVQEAIDFINSNEHPLTLYVFSKDKNLIANVENQTRSGSFVVNDTVIQLATSQLPFGGIGASGMGAYHGKTGFLVFSHKRAVLSRPFWLDLPVRYRPFAPWKLWILKKLFGYQQPKPLPSPLP
ncbi:aldehyde dehydrogenase family protein [bacterium]|nr:aldehyde dehydrogenase family protein [bacterium]